MTFGNILTAIKLAIPIGLLLGLLWFRHDAQRWHLAFEKLKAEYVAASQMAVWRQIASNNAIEARYSAIAEETHADYTQRLARAQRASDGFMRANRACPSSGTATAAQGASAQSVIRPDPSTDLVAVTAEDVSICTENTVRLESAQNWARELDNVTY